MEPKPKMEAVSYHHWAVAKASQIANNEGFRLLSAAENLDKKKTRITMIELQTAIERALREEIFEQLPIDAPSQLADRDDWVVKELGHC